MRSRKRWELAWGVAVFFFQQGRDIPKGFLILFEPWGMANAACQWIFPQREIFPVPSPSQRCTFQRWSHIPGWGPGIYRHGESRSPGQARGHPGTSGDSPGQAPGQGHPPPGHLCRNFVLPNTPGRTNQTSPSVTQQNFAAFIAAGGIPEL